MRRDGGDVCEAEPNWSELETAMRIRAGESVDVLCDGNAGEQITQDTDQEYILNSLLHSEMLRQLSS